MFRRGVVVLIVSMLSTCLVGGGAQALAGDSSFETVAARAGAPKKPKVTLKISARQVVEGDVVRLTARIPQRKKARRIVLQRLRPSYFSSKGTWEDVKKSRVKKKRIRFRVTVVDENVAKYRVVVTYKGRKKPVVSKPARLKVWRWIPLSEYTPYYATDYVGFGTASINGRSYRGWGPYTYSRTLSWEARFTPGRNCKAFRGVAGVTDRSDDGARGTITLIADDELVWQSPVLTPGMATDFQVALARPYRFAIQAANVSDPEIKAWPAIGDPAFLCTGV